MWDTAYAGIEVSALIQMSSYLKFISFLLLNIRDSNISTVK